MRMTTKYFYFKTKIHGRGHDTYAQKNLRAFSRILRRGRRRRGRQFKLPSYSTL